MGRLALWEVHEQCFRDWQEEFLGNNLQSYHVISTEWIKTIQQQMDYQQRLDIISALLPPVINADKLIRVSREGQVGPCNKMCFSRESCGSHEGSLGAARHKCQDFDHPRSQCSMLSSDSCMLQAATGQDLGWIRLDVLYVCDEAIPGFLQAYMGCNSLHR